MSSDEWYLYYWNGEPPFCGRGEFARLMFEEAGVQYTEVNDGKVLYNEIILGKGDGYPMFAPPVIKKGDFRLSQCHAICRYLGEEFGLVPDTKEEKALAEQHSITCHDFIAEGRLTFHGIHPVGPYLEQKEETQPYIDRFLETRLPRWLKYFERALLFNEEGKGVSNSFDPAHVPHFVGPDLGPNCLQRLSADDTSRFCIGNKCTYVDLTLFHCLRATEAQWPEVWAQADYIPALKAFKERMEARPKIAAYLKSNRCRPFAGDSMM